MSDRRADRAFRDSLHTFSGAAGGATRTETDNLGSRGSPTASRKLTPTEIADLLSAENLIGAPQAR